MMSEDALYDRICALNVHIDAAYNEMKRAEKERDELIKELKQHRSGNPQ